MMDPRETLQQWLDGWTQVLECMAALRQWSGFKPQVRVSWSHEDTERWYIGVVVHVSHTLIEIRHECGYDKLMPAYTEDYGPHWVDAEATPSSPRQYTIEVIDG